MRLRRGCLGCGLLIRFHRVFGNMKFQIGNSECGLEEDVLGVLLREIINQAVALSYRSVLTFHEEASEEDFIGCGR